MNYYEHHLGDYDGATAHLSWLEDCAYRRLLSVYYRTEQPIPADMKQASRLVRATSKAERDAVAQVLNEFFQLTDAGWRNRRCDEVIRAYVEGEPDREAKKENQKARQRRHREERAAMFEQLKAAGIVPDWNVTMDALRTLVTRHCNGDGHAPSRVTGALPVTPETATHSQIPVPIPIPDQDPSLNLLPSGRAVANSAREDLRAPEGIGTRNGLLEREHHEAFLRVQAAYPRAYGAVDWLTAERNCRRLVQAGDATWPELEAAATRYAGFVTGGGLGNPRCVTHPQRFFDPDQTAKPWTADWALPPPGQAAVPHRRRRTADELEAEELAAAAAARASA